MSSPPFTSPDAPADNIHVLVDWLKGSHDDIFVYRGQIRDYGPRLIPSAYRVYLKQWQRVDRKTRFELKPANNATGVPDKITVRCIRGVGEVFWGDVAGCLETNTDPRWTMRAACRQRFLNAFGYVLGSSFAQHYGLSSEHLDVTTDVDIAAFFATRRAPDYCPHVPDNADCGVCDSP